MSLYNQDYPDSPVDQPTYESYEEEEAAPVPRAPTIRPRRPRSNKPKVPKVAAPLPVAQVQSQAPSAPGPIRKKRAYHRKEKFYAHCNHCRKEVSVAQGEKVVQINGAWRVKGICSECGKKINAYPKIKRDLKQ